MIPEVRRVAATCTCAAWRGLITVARCGDRFAGLTVTLRTPCLLRLDQECRLLRHADVLTLMLLFHVKRNRRNAIGQSVTKAGTGGKPATGYL